MPGFEKAPDENVAENQMGKPLSGGNAPTQEGGLFDEGARYQDELFDERGPDAGPVVDNPAQGGNFEEATGGQISDGATPKTPDQIQKVMETLRTGIEYEKMKPDAARVLLKSINAPEPSIKRMNDLIRGVGRVGGMSDGSTTFDLIQTNTEGFKDLGVAPYTEAESTWIQVKLLEEKKLKR